MNNEVMSFLKEKRQRLLILPFILLPVWIGLYLAIKPFSHWLVFDLFGLPEGNRLTEAIAFFIYEVPKVLLLLILIVFVVGIIRSWFSPDRTRKILEGKSLFAGNVLASLLGIVTPFCSCSAIPLFLGFVESGIPLGVTFSFLIAAPMINEVAVILLLGMFGWKTALIYVVTGLVIAIISGWVIGKFKAERFVEGWVFEMQKSENQVQGERIVWADRIRFGLTAVRDIVKKVWLYIVIGIGVGAAAHGYVPADYMASLMGRDAWYAVPLSVLIGVPLYSNAAGIIPIVSVLIEKGASLGTALAFMMAVIGLSLPEMIILKKVLKLPMILIFIGVVATGIMIVGYLFNDIF